MCEFRSSSPRVTTKCMAPPTTTPWRYRLQHGVDESEALLEAVERHEGAHARAFLLPQQNLVERLEPIAQILVAVLLADRVDPFWDASPAAFCGTLPHRAPRPANPLPSGPPIPGRGRVGEKGVRTCG